MPPWFNPLLRSAGFAWVGVLVFVLDPAGPAALTAQAACYGAAALGLAAWVLFELRPAAARYRARWFPVVLGVIAVAAGLGSATGHGGIALAIYAFLAVLTAGGDLGLAPALAVLGAAVLATEAGGLVSGGSYGVLLGLPAITASGLVIGRTRAAYRIQAEQSAALLAQREQLDASRRRADLLDERARIAREIHDVLAHSLGALAIQIQAARSVLADLGDVDQAGQLLAAAQQMAAEGLTETRRAVHALREDTLPLADEMAKVTGEHAQRYQVAASFSVTGDARPLPAHATVALLRVAREALVNAAKHAPGQPVTVGLAYAGASARLTIRNDLARPATTRPSTAAGEHSARLQTADLGYGLTGMRERLLLLGGTLEAGREDRQWVVAANLPLPETGSMAS